jgi:hypothetical protein
VTEVWLRGPVEGIPRELVPAAHALLQAAEDVERVVPPLSAEELWARPAGAASVGFHAKHIGGSIDRLLTYARGEQLSPSQMATLRAEGEPGDPPLDAPAAARVATEGIAGAIDVLRATPLDTIHEPRSVGRAGLPSTVIGLLFHIAEHTQRHVGHIITTAKIVRGIER